MNTLLFNIKPGVVIIFYVNSDNSVCDDAILCFYFCELICFCKATFIIDAEI